MLNDTILNSATGSNIGASVPDTNDAVDVAFIDDDEGAFGVDSRLTCRVTCRRLQCMKRRPKTIGITVAFIATSFLTLTSSFYPGSMHT